MDTEKVEALFATAILSFLADRGYQLDVTGDVILPTLEGGRFIVPAQEIQQWGGA